jgi:flagellar basal-body rod protein FlgF
MIQGLYTAANGMVALEDRQALIANNIANAATPGFRRQDGVLKGFYDVLLGEMGTVTRYNAAKAPGGGVSLTESFTDISNGAVVTTGAPLDLALSGPGFFVVQTPAGERYTRNGRFTTDIDGELATSDGFKVLGQGGPIPLPGGQVEIDNAGGVVVDGQTVGQIDVVEFEDPHALQRDGNNLFTISDAGAEPTAATNTEVIPSAVEMANVQVPAEIANMILGLRAYAANQQVITSIDETMSRLIEQVATPV